MSTIVKYGIPYKVESNSIFIAFGNRGYQYAPVNPPTRNPNKFIIVPDCLIGEIGMNGLTNISPYNLTMCFSDEIIQKVWEKAIPVMNQNPNHVCKDKCGAWIVFEAYGDRTNEFVWEIDHVIPVAKGGTEICQTYNHYIGIIMLPRVMVNWFVKSLLMVFITRLSHIGISCLNNRTN